MKKVLLVGEHPCGITGNGLMMRGILDELKSSYKVTVFCSITDVIPSSIYDPSYSLIPSDDVKHMDIWGGQKLLFLIQNEAFDYVVFIGIDVWRYLEIMPNFLGIQRVQKFKFLHIFPYDLQYLDTDFVDYLKIVDVPLVYSHYGYQMLKNHVPKLEYFRPPMPDKELFRVFTPEERLDARSVLFPTSSPETFIFGFVGPNQIRKDPQKILKAFAGLKGLFPDQRLGLYMHTNFAEGVFNLKKYAQSYGLTTGDIFVRPVGTITPFERMPDMYNAINCFVNPSMQEGLSWTVIQAMKCGTPVIASNSTAHIELVKDYGLLVPCESPTYIPIKSNLGQNWIDAKSCTSSDLMNAMSTMLKEYEFYRQSASQGADEMTFRLSTAGRLSDHLKEAAIEVKPAVKEQILFMQHGSAGDILMSTRCLGPLREKHASLPLVYMTQKQYFGLLENNPNVDKVIEWNPGLRHQYRFVYNPHGEHILHGNFNSLDVKLADMYPFFCGVQPADFFIDCKDPDIAEILGVPMPWMMGQDYIVVHTTGGDPVFRTYENLNMVIMGLNIPVVQIGGAADFYCAGAMDLRGILSFTETAWVMKHAKAAVVIDSFPSHLAGALGTPAIVLYGPAPARVVGPIHDPEILWFDMEPDKLRVCKNTYNCYGRDRHCISPCIKSINPMTIKKNLKTILGM